jgi:chitodextrinase
VVTSRGTFPAWTASWIYTGGETVAYQGHLWKAKYYSRGTAPSARSGAWQDLGVD